MPLLPYCIIPADAEADLPAVGVRESAVEVLAVDRLRCLYSVLPDFSLVSAPDLQREALRFDAVIRELLAKTAVIPFRFPTLLGTADELRGFMAEHLHQYSAAIKRLADGVQMELRIEHASFATAADSGAAYLQARATATRALSQTAEHARAAAGGLMREWLTRNTARGLRCYALVPRELTAEFQTRMRSLSTPEGVTIVVSGPWPAAEFLDDTAQHR